jgi:hypothetical protein
LDDDAILTWDPAVAHRRVVTALELAVADAFAVILIWILLQAIHVY